MLSYGKNMLLFLRAHLWLLLIGACCELLYALYFLPTFPLLRYYRSLTDLGGIVHHRPFAFAFFSGAFIALFTLFGLALGRARTVEPRKALWLVLGFGALFALTLSLVYPITAIDMYNYVAQSLILIQYHADPTLVPASKFSADPLMALTGGWQGVPSPYGPLGILIDALPTLIVGRHLLANLLLLKLLFSGVALVEAYLAYKIVAKLAPAYALSAALFIAWNPFVLFECSVNGHNDIAMMLPVLLAVLALLDDWHVFALVLLVASVLVKYATLVLVPLFFVYSLCQQTTRRGRIRYALLAMIAALIYAAILYFPFWHGPGTLLHVLSRDDYYLDSLSSVLPSLYVLEITKEQVRLLGRLVFVPCYALSLWLSRKSVASLLSASFLCMFCLLAFASPYYLPWYALWPTVLAAITPRRPLRIAAFLMACGSVLSVVSYAYVFGVLGNFVAADAIAYGGSFVPALLVLLGYGLGQSGKTRLEEVGKIKIVYALGRIRKVE